VKNRGEADFPSPVGNGEGQGGVAASSLETRDRSAPPPLGLRRRGRQSPRRRRDAATSPLHPQPAGRLAGLLGGLAGIAALLLILAWPAPFIRLAQMVVDRSGLASKRLCRWAPVSGLPVAQLPSSSSCLRLAGGAILRNISRCPHLPCPRRLGGWAAWKPLAGGRRGAGPAGSRLRLQPGRPTRRWLSFPPAGGRLAAGAPGRRPHISYSLPSTRQASRAPSSTTPPPIGTWKTCAGYEFHHPGAIPALHEPYPAARRLFVQPASPSIYAPGYEALDSALLDLLGVRYVLTTQTIPNPATNWPTTASCACTENLDALPRAFAVPCAEVVPPEQMDYALRSLNPREKVVLGNSERDLEIGDWRLENEKLPLAAGYDCQLYA